MCLQLDPELEVGQLDVKGQKLIEMVGFDGRPRFDGHPFFEADTSFEVHLCKIDGIILRDVGEYVDQVPQDEQVSTVLEVE